MCETTTKNGKETYAFSKKESFELKYYQPIFYQEFNTTMSWVLSNYQKNILTDFNSSAFIGNVLMDSIIQPYQHIIYSANMGSWSSITRWDAELFAVDGRKFLIEIKLRLDKDYLKYPNTTLGEREKYNELVDKAFEGGFIPVIIWIHDNGIANAFRLNDYEPEWKWMNVPKNKQAIRNEYLQKQCGLYFKSHSKEFTVEHYKDILNEFKTKTGIQP